MTKNKNKVISISVPRPENYAGLIKLFNKTVANPLGWEVVSMDVNRDVPTFSVPQEVQTFGDIPAALLSSQEIPFLVQMIGMLAAVNAKNSPLYGAASKADKNQVPGIKARLDGVTTYTLAEAFQRATLLMVDDVVLMISQGEGAAPKVGSLGGSPNLGHGRYFANPKTTARVEPFFNEYHAALYSGSEGADIAYRRLIICLQTLGIHILSAVIDTLENTSRAAKGETVGPMDTIHVVAGPLCITTAREGYGLTLNVPREIAENVPGGLTIDTPPSVIIKAAQKAYPGLKPENVYVFTLWSKDRETRVGAHRKAWEEAGASMIMEGEQRDRIFENSFDDILAGQSVTPSELRKTLQLLGWINSRGELSRKDIDNVMGALNYFNETNKLPHHAKELIIKRIRHIANSPVEFAPAFVNSGTYDPNAMVGVRYNEKKEPIVFINAGYAALAEAGQGAILSHAMGNVGVAKIISDLYLLPYEAESKIFDLDPDDMNFGPKLLKILAPNRAEAEKIYGELNKKILKETGKDAISYYRDEIKALQVAGYQPGKTLTFRDFLFSKDQTSAVAIVDSMIGDSPYTNHRGIQNLPSGEQVVKTRLVHRDSLGQVRIRTAKITVNPIADTVFLSMPFLDQLASDWNKETYKFDEGHIRKLKSEFEDVHYNAIERKGDKYVLYRKVFLENPNLTDTTKQRALEIIETLKEAGGQTMNWLEIVED